MHTKLWNKDFILMLQGSAFSAIGDVLYSVAIGYWVYDATGSSALMGLMSSISMFMTMFLSPFVGSIVDKSNRKSIIVGMDLIRGILMLGVGALAFAGQLSVAAVLLAAVLASTCSLFFTPAVSTFMLDIIPHSDMVRGQSVANGLSSLINLVGKAVSGALVAFLGVPLIIVLNGVSYLISAFTELFLTVPKTKQQGQAVTLQGMAGDFRIAFHEIFHNPFLSLFIPVALIVNLLAAGPLSLMLPFMLEKGFTVELYGYAMSLETAASLMGVVILGIVQLKPKQRFRIQALGFVASVVFSTAAYLSGSFISVATLLFLSAFFNTLGNAIFNASLMLAMPEHNRGAILGLFSAFSTGGCAISTVAFGVLCDIFPTHLVFVVGTVLSALPMLYLCFHKKTKEFILTH